MFAAPGAAHWPCAARAKAFGADDARTARPDEVDVMIRNMKPKSAYLQVVFPAGFAFCFWLVLHYFPLEPITGPASVFNGVAEFFGWAGIVVLLLVAVVNAAAVRQRNGRSGR